MISELNIAGVFFPPLLAWGLIALPISAIARAVLGRMGFYRLVWHRPLVDLLMFVLIVAAVAAALPHWIPL
jgi:hypothetical protein